MASNPFVKVPMIGKIVSHYKIIKKLGEGGMGEVFLAEDTQLDREVALKFLPEQYATDAAALERFKREAKAAAALHHPNIITVHEIGQYEDKPFIAMAYIDGESLDHLIPDRGMELGTLLDLAVSLADALRAAHEQGIVHRDLKPANVMVDRDGRPRVLDFGLAKQHTAVSGDDSELTTMDATEQMTRAGMILGTYPYMSPEQAEGKPVDTRSDLFSFGVMLYEMAT